MDMMDNLLGKNIVLIDFMGVGKTTVGNLLSKKLGRGFFDCDDIIMERCAMKIKDIFKIYGEKYFREMEKGVLAELSERKGVVIATGGGAVLNPENIEKLKINGLLVRLKASPWKIMSNISGYAESQSCDSRPLLDEGDKLGNMLRLMHEREGLYRCCHYELFTDPFSAEEVSAIITQYLSEGHFSKKRSKESKYHGYSIEPNHSWLPF
ncbi:shikimate kinase [Anaerobacterium chartisolvens]|uniref:Shikimate kinase n=1 Tax=Anaerobacterium chartisolvens TaxID=1297424 RepID=A0A369BF79_9FIRM|nr:shikimate kinase [Anaerobacterium chartisolvens]RCX20182.1 shikimate kinase [Anaerobacterium chartisolvens]